jgi:hypothetical protein
MYTAKRKMGKIALTYFVDVQWNVLTVLTGIFVS